MKEWKNAEITELDITETANGGMPSRNFDQMWFDENGAVHVNFTPDQPQPQPQPNENQLS